MMHPYCWLGADSPSPAAKGRSDRGLSGIVSTGISQKGTGGCACPAQLLWKGGGESSASFRHTDAVTTYQAGAVEGDWGQREENK